MFSYRSARHSDARITFIAFFSVFLSRFSIRRITPTTTFRSLTLDSASVDLGRNTSFFISFTQRHWMRSSWPS